MRMQLRMAVAALSLGLLGSGCASISQVQTADTLGAGKFQVGLEPGVRGVTVNATSGDTTASGTGYLPQFDVSLRYGVTDHLDLGARVGTSLVELQGKYLFTDPANPTLAVSLAPSLSGLSLGAGGASAGYVNLGLPVLIGFKTKGGSELVIGPRLDGSRFFASSGNDTSGSYNTLSGGASLGYALRVSEGFRLMPEIAVSVPIVGAATATSGGSTDSASGALGSALSWQFRLGFLFGQGRPIGGVMASDSAMEPNADE
jgi:hypothetical protein